MNSSLVKTPQEESRQVNFVSCVFAACLPFPIAAP